MSNPIKSKKWLRRSRLLRGSVTRRTPSTTPGTAKWVRDSQHYARDCCQTHISRLKDLIVSITFTDTLCPTCTFM